TRQLHSICADDFSPSMHALATAIADELKPACMPLCVGDDDPDTAVVDPICWMEQQAPQPGGHGIAKTNVMPCDAGGTLPDDDDVCYVALGDAAGVHATASEADDVS